MVRVNGKPMFAAGKTVRELLDELGLDPARVAILVNDEVYPRGQVPERVLEDGDEVEIVTLMQGG